jgi:hypothetical protein
VTIAWHGSDLLYLTSADKAAVIDSQGQARPIDLTAAVERIPGARNGNVVTEAGWAGEAEQEGETWMGGCC